MATFTGTAGPDVLTGGDNDDTFLMGAGLNADDKLRGRGGYDTVVLDGDYSAGLVFNQTTMTGMEEIDLTGNFGYNLTTVSPTVTKGATMTVDASGVTGGNAVTFNGAAEDDGFFHFIGGGGIDTFTGGGKNDTFDMGGTLTADDRINGGLGNDTVNLSGDYASTPLVLGAATLTHVEKLVLTPGPVNGYNITLGGNGIGDYGKFVIDGSALITGENLRLDVSSDTIDSLYLTGGVGGDHFEMGGAFSTDDRIDGGAGYNSLDLNGDYSHGVTMNATNVKNVNIISVAGDHDYNLTDTGVVAPTGSGSLGIDGTALTGTAHFIFDASGTTQALALSAGAVGTTETWTGSAVSDQFFVNANFTAASSINGGGGYDDVYFNGDYSAGLTLGAKTITNVAQITFTAGYSYNITASDGTVASGAVVTIFGANLGASDHLIYNGSAETNGAYFLEGGAGSDTLTGGAKADTILGGLGADSLTGGGGVDRFFYNGVTDSPSTGYDTIQDFSTSFDTISLPQTVNALNAGVSGTLSAGSFDANLTSAVTSAKLGAGDALIFTATGGGLSGETFLIVDGNNTAGYQAGADYVIRLISPTISRFSLANLVSH